MADTLFLVLPVLGGGGDRTVEFKYYASWHVGSSHRPQEPFSIFSRQSELCGTGPGGGGGVVWFDYGGFLDLWV